jgi:hypothetical protein
LRVTCQSRLWVAMGRRLIAMLSPLSLRLSP